MDKRCVRKKNGNEKIDRLDNNFNVIMKRAC
jgi:hypothetical protein